MIDIKSFTIEELEQYFASFGEKSFRAKQVFDWLHVKLATSFDDMTNLSKSLRDKLSHECNISNVNIVKHLSSKIDGTEKLAFEYADGNIIESVLMRYEHGNSVCVSSQAGCRMGCKFCASTIDGLSRNLTASEILEQVYAITRISGERVSNVVIMGSGEPLDNYDNVIRFIRLISNENGYNMSARNITLSTCGLVPEIKKLAMEELPITLAISLHAPTDEKRREVMPIANKYTIEQILDACDYYFKVTGRRISFEYSLINGYNDDKDTITTLISLLRGKNIHVNLISVNPVKERNFKAVDTDTISEVKKRLESSGINATIRRRLGADIDSACGQLRRSVTNMGEQP
ncbi:MAG: 23S rRNA (adenine(2503)-C(2))-methyltransferase RlmN [Lachnospiraceae bacterium]|nr:23S rRNA (adenine(2503)-C(2))-methyltransferase RlmN [Candidatus Minthocola equi]